MIVSNNNDTLVKNTTHKVVLPFYLYTAISFLVATILISFSTDAFTQHYFHPKILAITHVMVVIQPKKTQSYCRYGSATGTYI